MQYFKYNDISIPLTCITSVAYTKSGNIVPLSKMSCKCAGINAIQVGLEISLTPASFISGFALDTTDNFDVTYDKFIKWVGYLCSIKPNQFEADYLTFGDKIIVPQLKFMLSSVSCTYKSDRNGLLQEVQLSWSMVGSKVVKKEAKDKQLAQQSESSIATYRLPKVVLHYNDKSIECSNDINISALTLSSLNGHIELLLADTYTDISIKAWLDDVNNDKNAYFEIEGYGKFYISSSYIIYANWLNFELTKFTQAWFTRHTKTFLSNDNSSFTLSNIFSNIDAENTPVEVKSKASFTYFKYNCNPTQLIKTLQTSLGYIIGLREDKIYLYDAPDTIPEGSITYDYYLDENKLTKPITQVILKDAVNEFTSGNTDGESYAVNSLCAASQAAADNVLKYVKFYHNIITMTVPFDKRIKSGCLITVNTGQSLINCVCTEYDINFIENQIKLELHYM